MVDVAAIVAAIALTDLDTLFSIHQIMSTLQRLVN